MTTCQFVLKFEHVIEEFVRKNKLTFQKNLNVFEEGMA
jgi:hypothetical protein